MIYIECNKEMIGWKIGNSGCKVVGLAIQYDHYKVKCINLSSM